MNKYLRAASQLFAAAALILALASCRKDEPNTPTPPAPQPPAQEEALVSKIVLRFQIGHLHGVKSFHHLPSTADLDNKNLQDDQMLTFELRDKKWALVPSITVKGSAGDTTLHGLDKLLAYRWRDTSRPNPFTGEPEGGAYPQYGILLEAYNAKGELLNLGELARKDAYQFFLYPSNAKDYDTGKAITPKADYSNLMSYVCLDSEVYNKSAHRNQTKFRPATDPINYKGYAIFPTLGSTFDLNIDLYATTKGKLEGGKASPSYAPNATVKAGKLLAHLTVPLYVFAPYSMRQYAATSDAEKPLRAIEDIKAGLAEDDDRDGEEVGLVKAAARRLEKILGKSWDKIGPDFTYNQLAPRANELTGGNFY